MENLKPLFPFFPEPMFGETVYSIFCRCIERSGIQDTYILTELTGQRLKHSLLSAIPGYISFLSKRIPKGHPWCDPGQIIRKHTAVPYYLYFDFREERERWLREFAQADSTNVLSFSLGLPKYRCGAGPTHPRYCQKCADEDRNSLGFTYFRREHQLPGVALCWKHGAILAHGCTRCGPYPIKGKAFCMPGKCRCRTGATPLLAYPDLPHDSEPLRWLASQAAFMVNSIGDRGANIRAKLRTQALEIGYGHGSQLDYRLLANAVEKRFGSATLEWLKLPAWTNGQPAGWIRTLLHGKHDGKRRSPNILFQLIIGTMHESLSAFENPPEESACSIEPAHIFETKFSQSSKDERKGFPEALVEEDFFRLLDKWGLRSISKKLGVTVCQLTAEVGRNGWRVPLPNEIIKKYGEAKINAIKNDLRSGVEKKRIRRLHQCCKSTLLLIELDEPGLKEAHKAEKELLKLQQHRKRVIDYISCNNNVTRSEIISHLSGTYDYLNKYDKNWFESKIPLKKGILPSRKGKRLKNWHAIDREMVQEVNLAFDEMLAETNAKPLRATQRAILKRAEFLSKYWPNKEKLPLITNTLNHRAESRDAFILRRIKWAINQVAKNNEQISLYNLKSISGLKEQDLRDNRQFIVEISMEMNITIAGRSYFARH